MAGTSIVTLSPNDVVMKYREPFLTKSLNQKSAVNTPPGIYRGFRLGPNPGLMLINIEADPDNGDHSAVYETGDGLSLTVARRGSFSIDLSTFAGKTVAVAIFAAYSLGIDTFAEIRIYELSPSDELAGSPEEDEIVILGTVVVPSVPGVIPTTDITNDRRSSAWLNVAPDALTWAPLLRNRGFEWGPVATGVGLYGAAFWRLVTDTNGRWDLSTGNPHTGLKHLEFTFLAVASSASLLQQVNVPVSVNQQLRIQFFEQLLQLLTAGTINFIVEYTGSTGNVVGTEVFTIADTLSTVDTSYEKHEKIFLVPANAAHISRIGFTLASVDAALAAPLWRIDSLDVWLETTALDPYLFQERKAAQVVESLVLRDPVGDFNDDEVVIDFDKDSPPGEGTVSIGRRDKDVSSGVIHPGLSLLGTIVGLGNQHRFTPTQAERPRISSTWASVADSLYTLVWELADPDFPTLIKVRVYAGPTQSGNFTVTNNARWDATAAQWDRDQINRSATKFTVDRARIKLQSVSPSFPGPWADTGWERTSFEHDTLAQTKLTGRTDMGADILLTDANVATPRIAMERASDFFISQGRTLMLESQVPAIAAAFYPIRMYRAYRTSSGTGDTLEFVSNAVWDPASSMWTRENTLNPTATLASKFTIMHDRIILQTRDSAGTWSDGAWDYSTNWSINSLGTVWNAENMRTFITNSGVQTNPSPTTFQTNVICAKNTCKVWGVVTTGGGGPVLVDGYNVTSVAYNGDLLRVNIASDMADVDYSITAATQGTLGTVENLHPANIATSRFDLRLMGASFSGGGSFIAGTAGVVDLSAQTRRIHFQVFGVQNS